MLLKFLLMFTYTGYTILYFYFIFKLALIPLGALIPLTLWIMIHFTWRYTNPEYKYTIDGGVFDFYVSYGKKNRLKFSIHIKDALAIAPKNEIVGFLKNRVPYKSYTALSTKSESEAYSIAFEMKSKVNILHFKSTRDAIKLLHYYNNDTIIENKRNREEI